MKIIEVENGLLVTISNEERALAYKIKNSSYTKKEDLSERETTIANQLIKKSIIDRMRVEGKICYKYRRNSEAS